MLWFREIISSAYDFNDMISYTMKSIMISYMKSGYDIMITLGVISCVIYACMYDRLDYNVMGMILYSKL